MSNTSQMDSDPPKTHSYSVLKHGNSSPDVHQSSKTQKQATEPPTNLVDLSIGSISNHLHQLEYPGWILQTQNRKNRRVRKLNKKNKDKYPWIVSSASQLLRPGLPSCQTHLEQRKSSRWRHLAGARARFQPLIPNNRTPRRPEGDSFVFAELKPVRFYRETSLKSHKRIERKNTHPQ